MNEPEAPKSPTRETEDGWICPQCNAVVYAPGVSDKKKQICQLGHEVEKPVGFFTNLLSIVAFIVLAAVATHAVDWIWSVPARLLQTFAVEGGMFLLPLFGLAKGLRHLSRSRPASRLAGGYFGIMLCGA